MEIIHLGHASFKLRGSKVTLITDPFNPDMLGLKFPEIPADVVTVSHDHQDHNFVDNITENPVIISGPGEYEVKGTNIVGISTYHDEVEGKERGKNTVFRYEIDGISLLHCGDLGHKFSDAQVESLNGIDILLIPVGGFYTLSMKNVVEVINQLEPNIIIPMHYHNSLLDPKQFGMLLSVDAFLKEMGKGNVVPVPKYSVTKDKKPLETTIVVLDN